MSIEISTEDSIFWYLLNRNIQDSELKYIGSVYNLEQYISNILEAKHNAILLENDKLVNIDNSWINTKYNQLLKLQLNIDLITDNIINLMEKY
tara:strand:- start:745 stop:1023 length:279 start_codon:yes stop_codon:yes gene_type:complete